ncbi:site-specific DNA-methyltransferase [Mycoplasmopsis bovis]|uniref:DNA methyltransferase n=1 Tax=Mycoplasmopsis bovis TaxID=28903 RepID=UPI003D80076D
MKKLLNFIIDISTSKNDIVLDFFLGSGTTAAVAHKINRRYIGIEQMDYIQDIAVERLKKVIDGEQGGISKSVNWQGGGSFVYCELLENSQKLINEVQKADESNIVQVKNKVFYSLTKQKAPQVNLRRFLLPFVKIWVSKLKKERLLHYIWLAMTKILVIQLTYACLKRN